MKPQKIHPLTAVLLILGAIASLFLLANRLSAEAGANRAASAVFYDDVLLLAEESGHSPDHWLEVFAAGGVGYVMFEAEPEEAIAAQLASHGLSPAGYVGGDSAFALSWVSWPETGTTPLALVENATRTAVFYPEGFDLNGYEGALVKALYINDYYATLYSPETKGKEVENLLFRAVMDRGIRLLLLRPFTDEADNLVTEAGVYSDVLSGLSARLEARGVHLGREFSCMDTKPLQPLLLACAGCLTAGLWLCLFSVLSPWLGRWSALLGVAAVLCLLAGCFLLPRLAQKLLMLLCAVVFPCLAVCALRRLPDSTQVQRIPCWLVYPAALCLLVLWSILGGLAVSALMSDRSFLMGDIMFSGVKVAQMLPLLLCFVLFGIPAAKDLLSTPFTKKKWLLLVTCGLLLAAVGGVMVIRSGDVARISSLETTFRNTLEYTLYVRPRTKELLIAVPFAAVFFTALGRKVPLIALLSGLCCCLECVSVVNTFCHAVAPIHVSLIRTLLAAGLGLIPGLILYAVCSLIFQEKQMQ